MSSPSENTPPDPAFPPPRETFFSRAKKRAIELFETVYETVWTPAEFGSRTTLVRVLTAVWRTIEITIAGTISNNIPMQAAALTYYALMALAPFVMLVLTIFGLVMNVQGEEAVELVRTRIAETIQLVVPDSEEAPAAAANAVSLAGNSSETPGASANVVATVAPQLEEFSGMILQNTMEISGSSGTIGTLVLAVLAIFMLARVEDAYNLIWNVKTRRSWARRFLVYFLFLVFGGAFSAITMSMLSVSAILRKLSEHTSEVSAFVTHVPGGEMILGVMTSFVPLLLAFVIMTLLFACVNRYLPHSGVNWRPALLGGAFVALTFIVCGKMASLFVKKISEFNSIYGNLSVIFILMFALYLSWMFLLLGGQVAYAAQNSRYFKNINRKWEQLSPRAKQQAYFSCLFAVFERCSRSEKGLTMEELGNALCIPANIVSECVDTLLVEKFIVALAPEMDFRGKTRYNAAGTVAKTSIADLRRRFDNLRADISLGGSKNVCSARERFLASFDDYADSETLDSLLDEEKT